MKALLRYIQAWYQRRKVLAIIARSRRISTARRKP